MSPVPRPERWIVSDDNQIKALPESPESIELTKRINQEIFASPDSLPAPMPRSTTGRLAWFTEAFANWVILVLAVINLGLVFFDFTYMEARPLYLKHAPQVLAFYDPMKGIEPHWTTEAYLKKADETFALLQTPTPSPQAIAALAEMREQSLQMIQDNPFAEVGLTGVFVQTKNHMRKHMGEDSSKVAFSKFWSPENLTLYRLQTEEAFYRAEIRPLIARNYYRQIAENGRPYDAFWKIDMLFIPIFLLEFLLRGIFGVKRGLYRDWGIFCATRWYDLVYFVPLFGYAAPALVQGPLHLVRFVSVAFRMQRLGLINPLVLVQPHTDRVVDLVTDLVNVKLLTNYQDGIKKMDFAKMMDDLTPAQREAMARTIDRSLTTVVTQVLPEVSPQLEALIARSVYQALDESPAFQGLKRVPILGSIHEKVIPMVVAEVLAGTQAGLMKAVHDPESRRLTEEAITKVSHTLVEQLARTGTEAEIKEMAVKMLEEQKRKILAGN
jgi:hypothetical protein